MCGIAGIVSLKEHSAALQGAAQAMTAAQQHRGPDDSGLEALAWANPAVIFGHRRLAIIDLSPAGHQPMHDPATGNWITFNGEIYNYREVRRKLEELGQEFRTRTDTEVILKAYACWGAECVQYFRGIFAFALYQPHSSNGPSVFIARDQLGVKPLYFYQDEGLLLFASEVRALLASGLVARRLDLNGLRSYLAYGSVQEPLTLVAGVQSLLPGHTLTWQNGQTKIERYWQVQEQISGSRRPEEIYEQMRGYLAEAVQLQLVADVPLGTFLSGGIDSSAISALAQRARKQPVKTFSIVFEESDYDERAYARLAARRIRTEHTELCLTSQEVITNIEQALSAFDQPSADGLNTYFVSKLTREAGLTVAMSGVGGDELFGGYNNYRRALMAEEWGGRTAKWPQAVRNWLSHRLSDLPTSPLLWQTAKWRGSQQAALSLGEAFRRAGDLLQHPAAAYFFTRQFFSQRQAANLLNSEVFEISQNWQPAIFGRLMVEVASYDRVNRIAALELQTYMLSTLLRDADQMSMRHALEVRVPFLDHKLVEFLFRLEGAHKIDPRQPKPLLTRALKEAIPAECVFRPKRGFELPFALWLKGSLRGQLEENFRRQPATYPFQPEGLARLWEQFQAGQVRWSRVWSIYVLRHWLEEHQIVSSC